MILLSIITVHLQDFDGLKSTLESLHAFNADSGVEWLVIDGGSEPTSDSERQILAEVTRMADQLVSEADDGIYDAMNKGTRLARGEYVLYLNAGDKLHPGFALDQLQEQYRTSQPAMIWGICHQLYPNGDLVRLKTRSAKSAWLGMPVNHQNILFKLNELGETPYSLSYKYFADYDLLIRLLKSHGEPVILNQPISIFSRGGVSAANYRETLREELSVKMKHYRIPKSLALTIYYFNLVAMKIAHFPWLRKIYRGWI